MLFGHMHEDAEIERAAFRNKGRMFCIASAGCTAAQLSVTHDVVACDINPVQLAYAERRLHGAAATLGHAERAMAFARLFMPLVGWRASVVCAFLAFTNVTEQLWFWRAHMDTRRFRTIFDTLTSRAILRTWYARRLLTTVPERFGTVLRHRLERGFARHANAANPYARSLLLGEAIDLGQSNASRVKFVGGDAASYLESCPSGSFDAFSLSNILDGAAPSYRERLSDAVRRAASKDAVVVLRSFGEPSPQLTTNHAESDRSMLWGLVDVRRADLF